MFNAKTIRSIGKLFLVVIIFLFATLFSSVMYAQNNGLIKKGEHINIPEKVYKVVLEPLPAGTYTIGTGGYFPTIDSAFNKLSVDGITGEIILELIDNIYSAPKTRNGFLLNGPIPGTGPNNKVIIKPVANKNVEIHGDGESVLSFLNTNYIIIDGVSLTGLTTLKVLTFQNTAYDWNDGIDFLNNSDHNVIRNIIFEDHDYNRGGGGVGFWYSQNSAFACDSNLIENNFLMKSGIAIYISAYNSTSIATGNIIRGNLFGSDTDSLIGYGIQLEKTKNTIVENNIIQNINYQAYYGLSYSFGINSYWGNGSIIRNNIIHNIKADSVLGSMGILLSGDNGAMGNNNQVYNNMIYDIKSSSTSAASRVAGIQMWNQVNPKIYYNSIYLSGYGNGANPLGSAALFIHTSVTNLDIKNNILVNTRNESPYSASAIYSYGYNLSPDYNDLYVEPSALNCVVKIGSTKFNTLLDWQATGKDLHSINEIVNFNSPSGLHINNNYFTKLDGSATPITGIDTDFDGQPRNSFLPDIGADEFDLSINASNWQMQNSGFPASVFIVDFSAVNNQVCWAVAQKSPGNTAPYVGYVRTTNGGNNWVCDTIPGISNGYMQQIFAIDEDTAYASVYVQNGESSKGIYKTTNSGLTWTKQNAYSQSLYGPGYIHFFDSQNGVVIGDPNLESYSTSNGGLTWNPIIMPPVLQDESTWLTGDAIKAIGNIVWFSTGARLFKSIDKGNSWTIIVSEPQLLNWSGFIAFQDTLVGIYAHKKKNSIDHLYRKTTDGGLTWNTLSNPILDSITATAIQYIPGTNATYVLTGDRHQGMTGTVITNDAGETWNVIDKIGNYQIIFPSNSVGWGSQWSANVIRKYVGPRITRIEEEQIEEVPTQFALEQNYPNPFNPSTTFRYSIPTQSKVVLKVYDILGNIIATLMDEEKPVGTYELNWNASNLSSGVYFYRLQAGDFVETKKMILIK